MQSHVKSRILTSSLLALLALSITHTTASAALIGFDGTQVSEAVYFPSTANRISNILTAPVGPGIEFMASEMQSSALPGFVVAPVNIDISGTQIALSYTSNITPPSAPFNGYIFTFSSPNPLSLPTITGLSLDAASNLTPTSLFFGADFVQVNMAGLALNPQSKVVIDLNVTPVPLPATVVLFGSGLVGLVGWQLKRLSKMV